MHLQQIYLGEYADEVKYFFFPRLPVKKKKKVKREGEQYRGVG